MPIIVLRLSTPVYAPDSRPSACPGCGSPVIQRWGQVNRQVVDAIQEQASIHRYHCVQCGHTFRAHPSGIDRSTQSVRMRHLAGVKCMLGMSCRDVVETFEKLGIPISRMAVWRNWQELQNKIQEQGSLPGLNRYWLDSEYHHLISNKLGVVVVIDLGPGRVRVLGTLNEGNPHPVKAWIDRLVRGSGIECSILTTSYLNPFKVSKTGRLG